MTNGEGERPSQIPFCPRQRLAKQHVFCVQGIHVFSDRLDLLSLYVKAHVVVVLVGFSLGGFAPGNPLHRNSVIFSDGTLDLDRNAVWLKIGLRPAKEAFEYLFLAAVRARNR